MRKKIAIIRGANLNSWELRNYEPLLDRYDITAFATTANRYDVSGINIPVVKVEAHPSHPDIFVEGFEDMIAGADIILSADITWFYSMQAVLAKKKHGCRVVCLEWENIPFAYEDVEFVKHVKRVVRTNADRFIAVSGMAKHALTLEGVREDIIDVIPMGVDLNRFNPACRNGDNLMRKTVGASKGETIILYVGRLVWEKGVYDLLHAAADLIRDVGSAVKLLIVGDGPEKEGLMRRADELGISRNVVFAGNISYEHMHHVYCLADIFVLPSVPTKRWQEQLGMSLIEAMACGLPVITTYSGALPEVVGDAGILVQPGDSRGLCRAFRSILLDRNLRHVKGLHSRMRAEERFSCIKTAAAIGRVFEKVLQQAGIPL
jgi:glycosyltransferase involved in cell wall biosynthesis